ncbi:YitT family protein [Eremococcus coleocola]|uniref:DUF2179 domain-containing protein n=1 Tax=Eremococcus coleocola ACS-139-V-Col8 TaxID=908337 RepID=E4KQE7_9LACT|nr:YitT family protein [Eremococcus coleocola]EFR30906.1 hypothetical protein HMPREF9257_1748 [Eremococcus coleocola ACS-139-V-Col8]
MNRLLVKYPALNYVFTVLLILFSSLCFGVSLNLFLIPGHIYSGGLIGFAQLVTYALENLLPQPIMVQTGTIYFLMNIPVIILSWVQLGRKFTLLTLVVVAVSSLASNIIPITQISSEPLLNAIVGGVIAGVGIGPLIRYGMSSGGLDIVSMVIHRKTGMNVGSLNFMMNMIIIGFSAAIYSLELALFTLISMFVTSYMINIIHTNEERLTVFIVTSEVNPVVQSIYANLHRGITILDAYGGYSNSTRKVLMVVINRYELFDLEMAVEEVDPKAFVNIIKSIRVNGHFLTRQQQERMDKMKAGMTDSRKFYES